MGNTKCQCMLGDDKPTETILSDSRQEPIKKNSARESRFDVLEVPVQSVGTLQRAMRGRHARASKIPDARAVKAQSRLTKAARKRVESLEKFVVEPLSEVVPCEWKQLTELVDQSAYEGEWSIDGLRHGVGVLYTAAGGLSKAHGETVNQPGRAAQFTQTVLTISATSLTAFDMAPASKQRTMAIHTMVNGAMTTKRGKPPKFGQTVLSSWAAS